MLTYFKAQCPRKQLMCSHIDVSVIHNWRSQLSAASLVRSRHPETGFGMVVSMTLNIYFHMRINNIENDIVYCTNNTFVCLLILEVESNKAYHMD